MLNEVLYGTNRFDNIYVGRSKEFKTGSMFLVNSKTLNLMVNVSVIPIAVMQSCVRILLCILNQERTKQL